MILFAGHTLTSEVTSEVLEASGAHVKYGGVVDEECRSANTCLADAGT